MNKIHKLISVIFFILLIFKSVGTVYAQKTSLKKSDGNRPNIIFLLTDDQRWDAIGAMGNTIIRTPNMDKLANAGILFQNAYVTTSICCVSRASILSGQYESKHKIHDFKTNFAQATLEATYPYVLKKYGYNTGFIGKYGVGVHPPVSTFDYYVNTEMGANEGKMQPDYITINKKGKEIHDTDTINNAIQDFLNKYTDKKPFCLSVSFKAPHEQDGYPPKYVIQTKYKDYYKNVDIPLAVTATDKYWAQLPSFLSTDENFGRVRWKGLFGTPELYQENVKNYYRLITGVDDVVGNILANLKATGSDKNTIIILMGDNGMSLGEHGMEGKWYGYEESIRVPLLIYDPNLPDKVSQYKASQIALNIDIAPTILSMAGVPIPDGMQGIDLISVVENKILPREDFFYQHYFLGGPRIPRVEGVVTKDFKYMNYIENNFEELFDIVHDPHETVNLAMNPNYVIQLKKMQSRYKKLKNFHGVPAEVYKKIGSSF